MAWTPGLHGRPMARRSQRRSPPRAGTVARPPDPWRRNAGAIFLAALALRVLYTLSIRNAYFFEHLQTDPLRYHQWAALILDARTPPVALVSTPAAAKGPAALPETVHLRHPCRMLPAVSVDLVRALSQPA